MNDTMKNDAAMENPLPPATEGALSTHVLSAEFLARRRAKNFAMLALILGLVVVIFIMTILKMKAGAS